MCLFKETAFRFHMIKHYEEKQFYALIYNATNNCLLKYLFRMQCLFIAKF